MGNVSFGATGRGRDYLGSEQGSTDREVSIESRGLVCGCQLIFVDSNLKNVANGPLPESVVATIEDIWADLKAEKEDNYIY
jgi:hypothetical protein